MQWSGVVVESLLGDLELSCPSRGGHSSSAAPSPRARQSAGLVSTTGAPRRVLPCKHSSRLWFLWNRKKYIPSSLRWENWPGAFLRHELA